MIRIIIICSSVDQLARVVSAIKQIYSLNERLKVQNVFATLKILSLTWKAGGRDCAGKPN